MIQDYWSLIKSHWAILMFGFLAVFAGNFGQSFFISWFGTEIQNSLELSATAYGSAYSLATLLSGFLIMFTGGLIDRLPLRWFVTGVSFGLVLAALLMWQANSVVALVIAFFLIRFCGQGMFPHTGITAMGRAFSADRGKAISFTSNAVPLGEIILPIAVVGLIALVGWQNSWLIIALFILCVLWPSMLLLLGKAQLKQQDTQQCKNKIDEKTDEHGSRSTLIKDSRFWLALPLILAAPFMITGLFIHQGFILSDKGWSSATFASAFIVYGICHWLSSIVSGWSVDKFTAIRLMPYVGVPFFIGLLLSALLDYEWASFVLLTCLGFGAGTMWPVINALWAEAYGTTHLGSIRSFTSSLMIISTAISPALFGYFIDDQVGANTLLYGMAFYTIFATVLAFFSYKNNEK